MAEALHAVIGHRRRGDPFTIEAGMVRVADALDMASGRSRVPFETRRPEHPLPVGGGDRRASRSSPGEERAVRIEIAMNNSVGALPGGRAAGHQAARLGHRGAPGGRGEHRGRAREAARAGVPDLRRRRGRSGARSLIERAPHHGLPAHGRA